MTPHELLIAARALIASPDNWCRGAYWIGKSGKKVKDIKRAVRFDLIGALARAADVRPVDVEKGKNAANEALRLVLPGMREQGFYLWDAAKVANDKSSHEELLELIDRAITASA